MLAVSRDLGGDGRAVDPTLVVVTGGAGWLRAGAGPRQPLGPGSWFVAVPGRTSAYGPAEAAGADEAADAAWGGYRVAFRGAALERWSRWGWLPDDGRARTAADLPAVLRRLEALATAAATATAASGAGATAAAADAIAAGAGDRAVVALEWVLLELSATGERPLTDDPLVNTFLALCRQRLGAPIDVPALAAELGVSYVLLRRRVRQATGEPVGRVIDRLRVERALALLGRPDLSIAEVAARVGVDDPLRFSRAFRRRVGTSPSAYRRGASAGGAP